MHFQRVQPRVPMDSSSRCSVQHSAIEFACVCIQTVIPIRSLDGACALVDPTLDQLFAVTDRLALRSQPLFADADRSDVGNPRWQLHGQRGAVSPDRRRHIFT